MAKSFVWDLPVRLFHWSLVLLIGVSFYTGFTGGLVEMDYHMLSGYGILTLIVFRILWGFVGGKNARFASFLRGPRGIWSYLRQSPAETVGHNPLGGLSVIAFLVALLIQATTGLFANDDILLEGPLAHLVSARTSSTLTGIHEANRWVLVGLIGLHLIAIGYHEWVRKHDLIMPMITGWKSLATGRSPERNNRVLAAILFASVLAGVYCLVTYL
jgi:cytochrome b